MRPENVHTTRQQKELDGGLKQAGKLGIQLDPRVEQALQSDDPAVRADGARAKIKYLEDLKRLRTSKGRPIIGASGRFAIDREISGTTVEGGNDLRAGKMRDIERKKEEAKRARSERVPHLVSLLEDGGYPREDIEKAAKAYMDGTPFAQAVQIGSAATVRAKQLAEAEKKRQNEATAKAEEEKARGDDADAFLAFTNKNLKPLREAGDGKRMSELAEEIRSGKTDRRVAQAEVEDLIDDRQRARRDADKPRQPTEAEKAKARGTGKVLSEEAEAAALKKLPEPRRRSRAAEEMAEWVSGKTPGQFATEEDKEKFQQAGKAEWARLRR